MRTHDSSISRRNLIGAAFTGAVPSRGRGAAASQRSNILYIHSHDTGRYIQPYGHAVPTPNLQKLAEGGVLFRQAFCAAPTCSPSRASLLSGQCPHSNGMLGLAHLGFSMTDYRRHILHTLRREGYYSALAGVQHIAKAPEQIGYDATITRERRAPEVARAVAPFLKNAPKTPFYLEVGFQETHREFRTPGPQQDARYCLPPAPIPDTPETRMDMAAFKASAAVMDAAVGDVMRALESAGLAENTLVISTTDHGIAFPSMKCNLTDHGMGVMLILRGPGGFLGGKVSDTMVSHIDVFPTICEVLEIKPPDWLEGRSILPLVRGDKREINEEVFGEINYHVPYEPRRAVRTSRWKYIRGFDARTAPLLANCDDGPSKDVWLRNGWKNRAIAREQLYDLVFDPCESRNLAADPAYRTALDEMRGRLDRWMKRTSDPLLKGPVPAPKGAIVAEPDLVSPKELKRF